MAESASEGAVLGLEVLAKYEPVIGLEVHVQLLTKSKIFCGCSTRFGDPPNTNVCPVCLGLPGALPVLNKRAVEMAVRASLALHCTVRERSRFARKNYFYPDLPKGYQISQYELPLATHGWVEIEHEGAKKRIGITRLHLEEDAAQNLHEGFSQAADRTESMRTKERAHDYRYFPEPDLLPVHISAAWRDEVLRTLPELPEAKRARFVSAYGATSYDAEVLTGTRALADYFEAVVKAGAAAKSTANWMQTELLRRLNDSNKEIEASPVSPASLAELVKLVDSGRITGAVGKKVFAVMFETGRGAAEIVAAEGLSQISDVSAIEQAAREVIEKNPENVAKYKAGNEGVFKFFVGQVMRATRGQANPQAVNDVLRKLLS